MDLRRRLSVYLAAFLFCLVAAVVAWSASALREDVAEELDASNRLVNLMRAAASGDEALVAQLAEGRFRHMRVALDRATLEQALRNETQGLAERLVARLADGPVAGAPIQTIAVGQHTLFVQPDPRSEIREIVRDAGQWILTVIALSLFTMGVVRYAVGRALAPARELEARIVALDDPQRPPPGAQRFALREFNVLAQAVDRLAQKLARARAAQRSLAQRLINVQEMERRDIARELHDEFGQSLTAIGLSAAYIERNAGRAVPGDLAESASDICRQSDHLGQHLRALLGRLRPYGLDGVGLVDTLRECVRTWQARAADIAVELALPADMPPLAQATALCLYRGLQEALTNVSRHSGASAVAVVMVCADAQVELSVRDNGCGLAHDAGTVTGVGLLGMRERVAMACGTLDVGNDPEGGLKLVLRLPIRPFTSRAEHDSHSVA